MTTDTTPSTAAATGDSFLTDSARRVEPASGLDMPLFLDKHADARELIGVVIATEAQRIARHESEARLGVDPDGVHQLRVAGRRLRCHLKQFRTWLAPEWVGVMRTETAWVTDALARVRDLEVMRDVLSACAASLPAADVGSLEPLFLNLAAQHADARHDMLVMLDDPRFEELLVELDRAATDPPFVLDGPYGATKMITTVTEKAWKKLDSAVALLGVAPNDAALHQVRLLAKRARFSAEAAVPIVGSEARRFARAMSSVQNVLGIQHDAVVAHHWVRQHAVAETSPVSFAGGMVAGLLRNSAASAAHEFPAVWRKASRAKLREWL
ncbi:MAG TPA: CHAD domain-containing protein [Acidimicrobiia bacterium]|jgi:CHAD domain-containing protein